MASSVTEEILSLNNSQVGPEAKEYNLLRADEEYRNGNPGHSIFYQVKAQFQSTDMRYINENETPNKENIRPVRIKTESIISAASAKEQMDYKSNEFFKNIISFLQQKEQEEAAQPAAQPIESMDFLEDIVEPAQGFQRVIEICNQLPPEWCVLQVCKSFNPATTYSKASEIMAGDGAIYLTLLRHCRSPELEPTCLRINSDEMTELFQEYRTIIERFRRIICVDPKNSRSEDVKRQYWQQLNEFETFLEGLIQKLANIITPYEFLFLGKRLEVKEVRQQTEIINKRVDDFCLAHNWSTHQRILLSQAALHANNLANVELRLLCSELALQDEPQARTVHELLIDCAKEWRAIEQKQKMCHKRYPVILIVDERLDHLHWEQLVKKQEFTRIKSLHSLWRLFKFHKANIKNGYYVVNLVKGMSIINPGADLPNSGKRLRSFCEYWLPHWNHLIDTTPSEDTMVLQAFNADCFIYAGHSSGLQYISSKVVCRSRVKGIVFLFGCDSTRLLGTGMYSAMYGAHNYYHGAFCPTVVGTLMPALDANMDTVSVLTLSRWLAPESQEVMPWTHIDRFAWVTSGAIKPAPDCKRVPTLRQLKHYQIGSLCSVLSLIHQGKVEQKLYNSCGYVCRGLPAWNVAVENLPKKT